MHDQRLSYKPTSGFTLIELAIVLLVVTLLLGALLVPLATQVEQRNASETQQRLTRIEEALIGFAIANGRFPCPASPTSNGVESPSGGGTCTNSFDGYVPAVTLGLIGLDSQGYAVDAWGNEQNRIRYAITNAMGNAFTTNGGMRGQGVANLGSSAVSLLYVCASGTGITPSACSTIAPPTPDPNALSRGDAVFVVYSPGKNAATTGGTSTDEAANKANKPVFVSKSMSNTSGTEFDDFVIWASRYSVISRLVEAGQLP